MSDNNSKNIDSSHVRFGEKIAINPSVRLPQFDNGLAKAYQAYGVNDKSKSYVALISGVENIPRCKSASAYNKLTETSFVRLFGSGIVNWKPESRQKYAFVYDSNMGKPLIKVGGVVECSWRHPDIVSHFIYPMASILREMADKSFAHGSIRPSNVFYSSSGQDNPIILGDGLSVSSGSSQPAIFLPLSKALTEEMGRGNACIEDDIYAFGISLAMFLRKNDSLSAVDDKEMFNKKMELGSYVAIIGSDRFPITFLELLRGVLHDDTRSRWNVDDILSWVDGARIAPPPPVKRKKANRPIVFNKKKYLFAEFLAVDLHDNSKELATIVGDGSLGQWIEKSIDSTYLTERFLKALERVAARGEAKDNMNFIVSQLRLAFCPDLPIYYRGRCFDGSGFGSLMVQSALEGENLDYYKEVLDLNLLDHALVEENLSQSVMISTLKSYDVCRAAARQVKYGYGLEKCMYMLCENAPCLSPKLKGYFVNNGKSLLSAVEKIYKRGKGDPLVIDMHIAAFFAVSEPSLVESSLVEISYGDNNSKIMNNLSILSLMQSKSGKGALYPAIASVFEKSLSKIYKGFRNVKMRKTIKDGVKSAAKEGDLLEMFEILSDKRSLTLDQKGFEIASYEYKNLYDEYNEYNRRLVNKATYGAHDGHGVAVSVSWVISIVLTIAVVLAFLSGNQMF